MLSPIDSELPSTRKPGEFKGVMKRRQNALLQRRRQIDQHVAATHHIDMGKGRVQGQVLARKDAQIAHRFVDAVDMVLLLKKTSQALGTDLGFDIVGINAGARFVQGRRLADIGGEDLNRRPARFIIEILDQAHGDRIGFLAGGATRHPNAYRR